MDDDNVISFPPRRETHDLVLGAMPNGRRFAFRVAACGEDDDRRARARRTWIRLKRRGAALMYLRRGTDGRLVRVA
jgi:hypothetical protein